MLLTVQPSTGTLAGIAVDATNVYVADSSDGKVLKLTPNERFVSSLSRCVGGTRGRIVIAAHVASFTSLACSHTSTSSTEGAEAGVQAHAEWIKMCALLVGCNGLPPLESPTPSNPMTSCVWDQLSGSASLATAARCIAATGGTCADAKTCVIGDSSTPCTLDSGIGCEGTVEVVCDGVESDNLQTTFDCASVDASCNPTLGCTTGPCGGTRVGTFCDGTIVMQCFAGSTDADSGLGYAVQEQFCDQMGNSTCGVDDGMVTCIGPGPACTVAAQCQGSTLVTCQGGHEASYDCTALGLTCLPLEDPTPEVPDVCAQGTECGFGFDDACQGNVLTYCDAGKVATLDCVAAGFQACAGSHCSS